MKLEINRDTWLRGEGSQDSQLLRKVDNKLCCLGFYSLACGLTTKDIVGRTSPFRIFTQDDSPKPSSCMMKLYDPEGAANRDVCIHLMNVNDDRDKSEAVREKLITELFAKIDVEVTFTGKEAT